MRDKRLLVIILLTAAALRLVGLYNTSPPGLAHDEIANWLIDRAILSGQHALYFSEAYGHEAGFHYWQTLFVALVGDHALALRLPAALAGLLVVAVSYALTRRLFGRRIALLVAALGATLFMPVFYGRLGLRAITLPLLAGVSADFWWRWWLNPQKSHRHHLLLSALCAGLATYTYLASRALPIFYGLFFLYLACFHWPTFKKRWLALVWFGLVYLLVAAPLILYLQTIPNAEVRIGEVDAPLQALLAGDVGPVLTNAWAITQSFGFRGDPLWRQNVAGLPIFGPLLGGLFYVGLLTTLWRLKDVRYAFVALWITCAIIPSLVTIDAPSYIRMIGLLPILTAVPFLPLFHNSRRLSTVFPQLSTNLGKNSWITVLTFVVLLFYSGRSIQHIFITWPSHEEVQFVWQAALTEMAQYVDRQPQIKDVVVAGWSPDTMDAPTMHLTLRRDDVALRHIGPLMGELQTAVVPQPTTDQPSYLLRPSRLPFNFYLEERLQAWGTSLPIGDNVRAYAFSTPPTINPQHPQTAQFGDELLFLGYDALFLPPFEQLEFVTYWRVLAVPTAERRFFLHMRDLNDHLLGQHDALSAPAQFWQTGDMIVQYHALPNINIPFDLQLGVYQPAPPWPRLLTATGDDHIVLTFDSQESEEP